MKYVPIFEKDGNKFFLLSLDFVGKTRSEAEEIGLGSMFVECILMGMKYGHKTIEINADESGSFSIPHVKAKICGCDCCIIDGKILDDIVCG